MSCHNCAECNLALMREGISRLVYQVLIMAIGGYHRPVIHYTRDFSKSVVWIKRNEYDMNKFAHAVYTAPRVESVKHAKTIEVAEIQVAQDSLTLKFQEWQKREF